MTLHHIFKLFPEVALRKESVDRNSVLGCSWLFGLVALRKESVDRNGLLSLMYLRKYGVALRKESVDRNSCWLLA